MTFLQCRVSKIVEISGTITQTSCVHANSFSFQTDIRLMCIANALLSDSFPLELQH